MAGVVWLGLLKYLWPCRWPWIDKTDRQVHRQTESFCERHCLHGVGWPGGLTACRVLACVCVLPSV